jgi:hypothetical protein
VKGSTFNFLFVHVVHPACGAERRYAFSTPKDEESELNAVVSCASLFITFYESLIIHLLSS